MVGIFASKSHAFFFPLITNVEQNKINVGKKFNYTKRKIHTEYITEKKQDFISYVKGLSKRAQFFPILLLFKHNILTKRKRKAKRKYLYTSFPLFHFTEKI